MHTTPYQVIVLIQKANNRILYVRLPFIYRNKNTFLSTGFQEDVWYPSRLVVDLENIIYLLNVQVNRRVMKTRPVVCAEAGARQKLTFRDRGNDSLMMTQVSPTSLNRWLRLRERHRLSMWTLLQKQPSSTGVALPGWCWRNLFSTNEAVLNRLSADIHWRRPELNAGRFVRKHNLVPDRCSLLDNGGTNGRPR